MSPFGELWFVASAIVAQGTAGDALDAIAAGSRLTQISLASSAAGAARGRPDAAAAVRVGCGIVLRGS